MTDTENQIKSIPVNEQGLLALAALKLKNVVLFPENLEQAKEYLDKTSILLTLLFEGVIQSS